MAQKIAGTIAQVERLQNSYAGNPRYSITLTDGQTFRTAADHGFVYAGIPAEGTRVELTIGGRGTITDLTS